MKRASKQPELVTGKRSTRVMEEKALLFDGITYLRNRYEVHLSKERIIPGPNKQYQSSLLNLITTHCKMEPNDTDWSTQPALYRRDFTYIARL